MVQQIGTFAKTLFAAVTSAGGPPERIGTKRNCAKQSLGREDEM
jgi:hypothetical protein